MTEKTKAVAALNAESLDIDTLADNQLVPFSDAMLESMPPIEELIEAAIVEGLEFVHDELQLFEAVKKEEIEGCPMFILQWIFKNSARSSWRSPYVIVFARIQQNGEEKNVVFADGSKGICERLRSLTETRISKNVPEERLQALYWVPGGIKAYSYNVEVDGNMIPATTYRFQNGNPEALNRVAEIRKRINA